MSDENYNTLSSLEEETKAKLVEAAKQFSSINIGHPHPIRFLQVCEWALELNIALSNKTRVNAWSHISRRPLHSRAFPLLSLNIVEISDAIERKGVRRVTLSSKMQASALPSMAELIDNPFNLVLGTSRGGLESQPLPNQPSLFNEAVIKNILHQIKNDKLTLAIGTIKREGGLNMMRRSVCMCASGL